MVGRALGVKWQHDEKPQILEADSGPSVRDLAANAPTPIAGGDTLAASRAIIEAMARGSSSTIQ